MLKLCGKLAVSNLIKNRKLYYPFALATCLVVAISYIFNSLTFNPNLSQERGGVAIKTTLGLGIVIVTIAAGIIILYANSFVMKNRSKELGLYGMLGLNKRHLFIMVFLELLIFGLVTVSLGLGLGVLFDNLIYAFLLKLMSAKVALVSTFQLSVLISVVIIYALIFALLAVVNGIRIFRFNALQLAKEKNSGEKKGHFLLIQTIAGLLILGMGYMLAVAVTDPMSALAIFFLAVLLVILATYILFNAGVTVFLHLLKKKKSYYYQPNNMISVSNLIFRMKKNAVGLATISILSTMVLVTLSGGVNIYAGGEYLKQTTAPHDFSMRMNGGAEQLEPALLEQTLTEFAAENQLTVSYNKTYRDYVLGIKNSSGNQLDIFPKGQRMVLPKAYILLFSEADYQKMTGKSLNLTANETALFVKKMTIDQDQPLKLLDQELKIKEMLKEDFVAGNITDQYNVIVPQSIFMVVKNPEQFLAAAKEKYEINSDIYAGLNVKASEEKKASLSTAFKNKVEQFNQSQPEGTGVFAVDKISTMAEVNGMFGGVFFIGIFLSLVFMLGTVLVIYYKQISEGFEDRERFVILQKVGLDEKQTKKTIGKQVRTVFFLPLIFSFIHLAFAYHMLSLILQMMGVLNADLRLIITLAVCAVFLIVYILVFQITSRSYRKIVSM